MVKMKNLLGIAIVLLLLAGVFNGNFEIKTEKLAVEGDVVSMGMEGGGIDFSCSTRGNKWWIQTVDEQGDVGAYTSIALDNNSNPHISYYDSTNQDLKYAYYDGVQWHIETVDSEGYVGGHTSIVLDTDDRPHISYREESKEILRYAYYDGGQWHLETLDSKGKVGEYTSIALDGNDRPHISYWDETNDDLKYAYYDGAQWHNETVDSEGDVGEYTSMALDSNDRPHISYRAAYPLNDLKYAYYDGVQWHNETADSEGKVGQHSSIALDSNDRPHIGYRDYTNSAVKYAYYNGAQWHNETVDSEGNLGFSISIALDSNDRPHISHWDGANSDLKYACYDGAQWHNETVDSQGGVGSYTSIALDSNDRPHISYCDITKDDLKYAVLDNTPPIVSDNTMGPATTGDNLTFNATATDDIHVETVNLEYWYGAGGHTNLTMNLISGNYFERTIIVNDTVDVLYYFISVKDGVPNWNDTGNKNLGNVTDNDAPAIIDHTIGPATTNDTFSFNATTNDTFSFNASINDNIGTSKVCVEYWYGDGAHTNITMNKGVGDNYSATIRVINTTDVLHYNISTEDNSSNWGETGEKNVGNVVDNDPPEIIYNTDINATTGESYTFNATIKDNIGVSNVIIEYWYGAGMHTNVTMNNVGGDYYEKTIVVENTTDILYYNVSANDTVPNWADTGARDVGSVVDNDDPVFNRDDTPDAGTTGDPYTFDIDVSDNVGVGSINVTWSHGDLHGNEALSDDGDGTWSLTIDLDDSRDDLIYEFQVNDTSGNFLRNGIETTSITDNDNPNLDADNSPATGTTGDSYTINITALDNIKVASVNVTWFHGSLSGNVALNDDGGGTWSLTITLDHDLDNLLYMV